MVHLAAAVGVGQSMYRIADYVGVNDLGTAVLLEALMRRPVGRLVVASSMSVYGEGLARDAEGRRVEPEERRGRAARARRRGSWKGPTAGRCEPLPTPETKRPSLSSVYALGKYSQERMCLIFGRAYDVPTVALRFFNVFGTRQALSNPYTGVLAIFASRLLNGRPPVIFEDGRQRRDFVHVRDVARACRARPGEPRPPPAMRSMSAAAAAGRSPRSPAASPWPWASRSCSRRSAAATRAGDIRHCFADLDPGRAPCSASSRRRISTTAWSSWRDWLAGMVAVDRVDEATAELKRWGLVA